MMLLLLNSNTTGVTCGEGVQITGVHPSGVGVAHSYLFVHCSVNLCLSFDQMYVLKPYDIFQLVLKTTNTR